MDAEQFHSWLINETHSKELLKGVKYTVFALGNSSYETFCGMGLKTDLRLEELGGERLFPLGKVN
jgi:sulfite reductase alpha subunit-like flavoprotein